MLKPLALAVLIAAAQPVLAATTWSYDFSGNLSDYFDHTSTANPATVAQSGGKLIFNTQGVAEQRTQENFFFKPAQPTYQQSWTAQIDVAVPASLQTQTVVGTTDYWAAASLFATVTNTDGSTRNGMSIDLEPDPPTRNQYWAGTWGGTTTADQPSSDLAGTIWLSFDASTKLLKAYSAHGTLLSQTLNDPISGWGMNNSDHFNIYIGFDTQAMSVQPSESLSIDNFSLTVAAVPEPETYALMLAGLGLVGVAARRWG